MSSDVALRRWRLAVRLMVAALVWSVGLALAALLLPAYNGQTISNVNGLTLTTATFVQVNGLRALTLVAIPAIVSVIVAFALWQRHRHQANWTGWVAWTAIGLLALETLLGITTIGLFIIPVPVLLAVSVRLIPGPARAPSAPAPAPATET
jgi:hypothetical protein